jgi:hypothetical protein
LLCQRSVLRKGRVLILVAANIPLVIIVYFLIISPDRGRITVKV